LLQHNPVVDHVHLFPRQNFRGLPSPFRLLSWARHFGALAQADLVLDFQCLLRSGLIGHFCRRSAFFGLSDAREGSRFFYDGTARVSPSQHAVERYLALVRALDVPVPEPLEWPLPPAQTPAAFPLHAPFITLHPFSRGKGKSLSVNEVHDLCKALSPRRVILLGRSDETVPPLPHVENWLNRTSLLELTAILKLAHWNISVDSGPMHIAAAVSPNVLALHTWSDPQKVGPYPPTAWVWKNRALFRRSDPENTTAMPSLAKVAQWLLERTA
jgi:ADP-heptose:LPS heptosyltransferase